MTTAMRRRTSSYRCSIHALITFWALRQTQGSILFETPWLHESVFCWHANRKDEEESFSDDDYFSAASPRFERSNNLECIVCNCSHRRSAFLQLNNKFQVLKRDSLLEPWISGRDEVQGRLFKTLSGMETRNFRRVGSQWKHGKHGKKTRNERCSSDFIFQGTWRWSSSSLNRPNIHERILGKRVFTHFRLSLTSCLASYPVYSCYTHATFMLYSSTTGKQQHVSKRAFSHFVETMISSSHDHRVYDVWRNSRTRQDRLQMKQETLTELLHYSLRLEVLSSKTSFCPHILFWGW